MQLAWLTPFGLFAVASMLACYALEDRSTWFVLAFAGSCALGSAYGFLQGAWPFGGVEGIWTLIGLRRWELRVFAGLLGMLKSLQDVQAEMFHRHFLFWTTQPLSNGSIGYAATEPGNR